MTMVATPVDTRAYKPTVDSNAQEQGAPHEDGGAADTPVLEVELVGAHEIEAQHQHECGYAIGRNAEAAVDEGLRNVCATAPGSVLHLVGSGIGKGLSYGLWLHSTLVGATIEDERAEGQ